MPMPSHLALGLLAAALAAAPSAALAHRSFLVPSSTMLSSTPNQWVTVDAARGNDLFFFNHNAMPVDGLTITAPDESVVKPSKIERFRYRTVFDLALTKPGTWRVAVVDDGLRVRWTEGGVAKRWNGPAADFTRSVPAQASGLHVNEVVSRVETFVTMGSPTPLRRIDRGLEATYVPHPNDLVAGEPATMTFMLDGRPLPDLKVLVVPGAARYRNQVGQIEATTDGQGRITVTWPHAGLYWLSAATQGKPTFAQARRKSVSYVATLEVLPQ